LNFNKKNWGIMESDITICCGNNSLEAKLNENGEHNAVVVTHPHPLYGGNMDNWVVTSIAGIFLANRFTTLRFNFRGTGKSTGMYDDGNGEQDDLKAAISFLQQKGYEKIWLAGYSFGSKITALAVSSGCAVQDHIMIAPPVAFMSFDDIEILPRTGLVITGENDDFAPPDQIRFHLDRWGIKPQFEMIKSCDHFFSTGLKDLEVILNAYLSAWKNMLKTL
jgi:uncharacterized protein